MIGMDSFRNFFMGYENEYVIIGGAACELLMMEENRTFRATKDIDIVLIVEALTPDFGRKMWEYIKDAGYEHLNKSTGGTQFYRFSHPKSKEYPAMIELFSRHLDQMPLYKNAHLTPIPIEDDISSLSAILLNDTYYNFLRNGQTTVDGISILKPEYIIPFKAKAWLDLSFRKTKGEHVDSRDIRKHRNDVFRLTELLTEELKVEPEMEIKEDMLSFIKAMESEQVNVKQLGVMNMNQQGILDFLRRCYLIE